MIQAKLNHSRLVRTWTTPYKAGTGYIFSQIEKVTVAALTLCNQCLYEDNKAKKTNSESENR